MSEAEQEGMALTIFEAKYPKQQQQAIKDLLDGRTPENAVKQRVARGGGNVNYVNTYYMIRIANLVTGFRWASEYIEDRARPNWDNPIEVGVRTKITVWDKDGNSYSHSCWGSKDVARYASDVYKKDKGGKFIQKKDGSGYVLSFKEGDIIALFDDLKAAESDSIKKGLSYFGIANDVYGGKELEFFEEESTTTDSSGATIKTPIQATAELTKYVQTTGIMWSKVFAKLGVQVKSEITDPVSALETIKKAHAAGEL